MGHRGIYALCNAIFMVVLTIYGYHKAFFDLFEIGSDKGQYCLTEQKSVITCMSD